MTSIENICVSRLRIPLTQPYKLSLGAVRHFDTILVELAVDGNAGLGEATILNGYTDETIEDSWALAKSLAERLNGRTIAAVDSVLDEKLRHAAPFTFTAFATAIEMARGAPMLDLKHDVAVPLLCGINSVEEPGIEREIEAAVAAGFRTLKIKVGFDVAADLRRVAFIQRVNRGRAALRIDANQGYSRKDACTFVSGISADSVELIEQPSDAKDWAAAEAAIKATALPLMLDESIYGIPDIERAARIGARYVKLKLMKCGSLGELARGLDRIRELGMKPVLGNGVASDIGCWMEACVASAKIDNAGEMNGFLRQKASVVLDPMPVVDGAIKLKAHCLPALSDRKLDEFTIDRAGTGARMTEITL